jgi:hypothetical protein
LRRPQTYADSANLSIPEQSSYPSDEITVLSGGGKRLDQNLQVTIAPVETLRIKRQQHGRSIVNDLSSVAANLFLEPPLTTPRAF